MTAWVLRLLAHRRAPWLAAAAAVALSVPALSKGFLDLAFPWWAAPDLKLSLFRPLAGFTHYLDY